MHCVPAQLLSVYIMDYFWEYNYVGLSSKMLEFVAFFTLSFAVQSNYINEKKNNNKFSSSCTNLLKKIMMIVLSLMHTCWRFVSPIEEKYPREHTSTAQDVPQNRWFNKKNRWLHWTAYMYIKKILISVQWSFHRIRATVHSAMVLIEVWIIFLYFPCISSSLVKLVIQWCTRRKPQ